MSKLLFMVLPMLLPFVLYGIYRWGAARRARRGLSEVPWIMLFAASIVLVIIGLATLRYLSGYEPGLNYAPARLENGRIVPAETK